MMVPDWPEFRCYQGDLGTKTVELLSQENNETSESHRDLRSVPLELRVMQTELPLKAELPVLLSCPSIPSPMSPWYRTRSQGVMVTDFTSVRIFRIWQNP